MIPKIAELSLGEGINTLDLAVYADGGATVAVSDNGVQNMVFGAERDDMQKIRDFLHAWLPTETPEPDEETR